MIPAPQIPLLTMLFSNFAPVFKIGFIIFAVLHFIFTLIVLRQVNLMTMTIITQGGPILRILAIGYALFALLILIYFVVFF